MAAATSSTACCATSFTRYLFYDTLLCYLYNPQSEDADEFGDGTEIRTPSRSGPHVLPVQSARFRGRPRPCPSFARRWGCPTTTAGRRSSTAPRAIRPTCAPRSARWASRGPSQRRRGASSCASPRASTRSKPIRTGDTELTGEERGHVFTVVCAIARRRPHLQRVRDDGRAARVHLRAHRCQRCRLRLPHRLSPVAARGGAAQGAAGLPAEPGAAAPRTAARHRRGHAKVPREVVGARVEPSMRVPPSVPVLSQRRRVLGLSTSGASFDGLSGCPASPTETRRRRPRRRRPCARNVPTVSRVVAARRPACARTTRRGRLPAANAAWPPRWASRRAACATRSRPDATAS